MKQLIEEIRTHFASQVQGIRMLKCLPADYKAYSFRQGVEYGVAIETTISKEVYEEAAQITIKTFNNLGIDNGENRRIVLSSPLNWWDGWIGMLGNKVGGKKSYDTIAEMMALEELFKQDNTITWTASQAGSHDLESDSHSYEVKSTIMKSEAKVTISSQFQLDSVRPLQLWFYRMEASEQGVSINDMIAKLIATGYDGNLIESQLEKRGFMLGSSIRDRKYVLLEKRKYTVDDHFPRIVESSFKNNVYPKNIIKILYTIDLEGIDYD